MAGVREEIRVEVCSAIAAAEITGALETEGNGEIKVGEKGVLTGRARGTNGFLVKFPDGNEAIFGKSEIRLSK